MRDAPEQTVDRWLSRSLLWRARSAPRTEDVRAEGEEGEEGEEGGGAWNF